MLFITDDYNGCCLLQMTILDAIITDGYTGCCLLQILCITDNHTRFFVLQITILDAVPDINMIVLLPEFLDGLFNILGDSNPEISKMYAYYY